MTVPTPPWWSKADPELRKALRGDRPKLLKVVIALDVPTFLPGEPAGTPAERAAVWAEQFRARSEGLVRAVEALGARVTEHFWINSSIAVEAPPEALEAIAARDDVRQIILNVERNIMLS